jgi:hypothetical protein
MENNLQDIFIPYEESLELKELGFNEKCLAFHWQKSISRGLFIGVPNEKYDIIINSPTWEQSFKFFREKYNLRTAIIPFWISNTYMVIIEGKMIFENEPNQFNFYEEAREECLKKIIKIVKDK